MKVYISPKLYIYLKWFLFLFSIASLIATFFYVREFFYSNSRESFWCSIYFVIIGSLSFLSSIAKDLLMIENDKVILKGIFSEKRYAITDFREITTKRWSQTYLISFNDGKSFWFTPKRSSYLEWFYSYRKGKVDKLNNQINSIIKTNTIKN